MAEDTEELKQDIEATRRNVGRDVDALTDKVSPGRIVDRRVDRARARMNRAKFHLYTTLGSWPWCFALAWIGMKLGDKWDSDPRIKAAFHSVDAIIVVLVLAGAGWFIWHRTRGKRKAP